MKKVQDKKKKIKKEKETAAVRDTSGFFLPFIVDISRLPARLQVWTTVTMELEISSLKIMTRICSSNYFNSEKYYNI